MKINGNTNIDCMVRICDMEEKGSAKATIYSQQDVTGIVKECRNCHREIITYKELNEKYYIDK